MTEEEASFEEATKRLSTYISDCSILIAVLKVLLHADRMEDFRISFPDDGQRPKIGVDVTGCRGEDYTDPDEEPVSTTEDVLKLAEAFDKVDPYLEYGTWLYAAMKRGEWEGSILPMTVDEIFEQAVPGGSR